MSKNILNNRMNTGKDVFPPMVYEGNEKYIFVSYAHKDAPIVLPIVETLGKEGFRVWYDSGIEAGTEWPEYIEDHLARAEVVLIFMSPSAVDSRNCRNEINFALELKKEVLVVYLEQTTLLKGMRLQLNSSQSLYREHHQTEETFVHALVNARILQCCRNTYADGMVPPAVNTAYQPPYTQNPHYMQNPPHVPGAPATNDAKPKRKVWPVFLIVGCVIAMLAMAIFLFAGGDRRADQPGQSQSENKPSSKVIEMSDELFDYTVSIEGTVYQFPCQYQVFVDDGWTISSSDVRDTTKILAEDYVFFQMANNGKVIWLYSYNMSGNSKQLKDCFVGGIQFDAYNKAEVKLAKDICLTSTIEEVLEAFGTPNDRYDGENSISLTYSQDNSVHNSVKFTFYKDTEMGYNDISVKNFLATEADKTQTNTDVPEFLSEYQVPTALEDNITSCVVKIGGDLYRLPAPVSAFTDNGWTISSKPDKVLSGKKEGIEITRDGVTLYVHINNLSDYQTIVENCVISKVRVDSEDGIDMELSGNMKLGTTRAEVESAVTEDFSTYSGSNYDSWSYFEYTPRDYWVDIYVDKETGLVNGFSVNCNTWDYETQEGA